MASEQQTLSVAGALRLAVNAHQSGNLQQAEALYKAVLTAQPNHPDAAHNLGVLAMHCERPDVALPLFETALQQRPQTPQFWKSAVNALLETGNLAKAEARSLQYLGLNPTDADAQAEHARILLARAKMVCDVVAKARYIEEAQAHMDKAQGQVDPLSPSAAVLRNLVRLAFSKKDAPTGARYARQVFALEPGNLETLLLMASTLLLERKIDEAAELVERVLKLRPGYAEALATRAGIFMSRGNTAAALADFEAALARKPHLTTICPAIATLRRRNGDLGKAAETLEILLRYCPDDVSAMSNLGALRRDLREYKAAETVLRRAVELAPKNVSVWLNLGTVLADMGNLEEAIDAFEAARMLDPNKPELVHNLGSLAANTGKWDKAYLYYKLAVRLQPHNPEMLLKFGRAMIETRRSSRKVMALGNFLLRKNARRGNELLMAVTRENGRFVEAYHHALAALKEQPDDAELLAEVGRVESKIGLYVQAEQHFTNALQMNPDFEKALSALLFVRNYTPHTPEQQVCDARRYGELVRKKVREKFTSWNCNPNPEKLRIGFVSGDFKRHSVGYFLESLMAELRHTPVELYLYATASAEDELTSRLRASAHAWIPIYEMSDYAAARHVHEAGIHVLVDLSGHTNHHRLPMFACKPAPVQATWLGFPNTTGVSEIDYIVGDALCTPLSESDHYVENIWQLPENYICFTPQETSVQTVEPPALRNGYITFGSLNNLSKMNDRVVALWARVLNAVPESRLLLKTAQLCDSTLIRHTQERFAAHGVAPERIDCIGFSATPLQHLSTYNQIDIALDPFPYQGVTTTCEALWMGVPVLGLKGANFLSHQAETLLPHSGLPEWVAADADEYVAKAVAFSSDVQALAALRATQRERVLASPMFDASRFAKHFADAMWQMWERFKGNRP